MRLLKALKGLPLIATLRRTQRWAPGSIVNLSLASPILRPLQVRSELERFAAIVDDLRPNTLLEIGTDRGGTLCIFSRLAGPDSTIISLDLPTESVSYRWFFEFIFKSFTYGKQRLHLLRGDSQSREMAGAVRNIMGESKKLDLLFIDGDHSYKGVKRDFELYSDLVRPGGVIAFHDIAEHPTPACEVSKFWSEIKSTYRHEEIIENRSQGWAGIGILYV